MNSQHNKRFHFLLKKCGYDSDDKREMIFRYTDGRTTSSKELEDYEVLALINWLDNQVESDGSSCDNLRKTLISMGYRIGWEVSKTIAYWQEHGSGGVKKRFNDYTQHELMCMIKTMEKILKNYGKSTDRMHSQDIVDEANRILNG